VAVAEQLVAVLPVVGIRVLSSVFSRLIKDWNQVGALMMVPMVIFHFIKFNNGFRTYIVASAHRIIIIFWISLVQDPFFPF